MPLHNKTAVYGRLKRTWLNRPADALRDLIRCALKEDNKKADPKRTNEELVAQSWQDMSDIFMVSIEEVEQVKEKLKLAREELKTLKAKKQPAEIQAVPEPTFDGYTGVLEEVVDQNYKETDAGKRLRDAFVWVGDEFRRITTDYSDGCTVMDFTKATTPPPTALAVQIAEEYAQCKPGQRRELFSRLISFAVKSHTPVEVLNEERTANAAEADAYLAEFDSQ